MWPKLASTRYLDPRKRPSVLALAGDSTMTSGTSDLGITVGTLARSSHPNANPGRRTAYQTGQFKIRQRAQDRGTIETRRRHHRVHVVGFTRQQHVEQHAT